MSREVWRCGWKSARFVAVALVATILLWWVALRLAGVPRSVGQGPDQVWQYLFDPDKGAARRGVVFGALAITLRDAGLGYLLGLVVAGLGAVSFVLIPPLQKLMYPTAVLLRTFPLVVLAPLIILLVGRGLTGVAVIGIIVVFFDGLVIITAGLRGAPRTAVELILAYGGSDLSVLRRVALPSAIPAVFAAARLAFPVSLTGALLAEWLATGHGIGAVIHQAPTQFHYAEMWAAVVAVTGAAIILSGVLQWLSDATHAAYEQEAR
ncbi:MAG: ABC transporter permease subunit [Bifidobacteriaceae bacterium]|jgi:ABC-type nitrate/sulfonate/bicarbonate transport system permease component|nr:ABC transporter permease subunit [Bifidobacteriaceae bacterium]